jgi:hypothetical protein
MMKKVHAPLAALLFASMALLPLAASADLAVIDGAQHGQAIFDFTCFTTKHCEAHVPIDPTGSPFGVISNPFYVAPVQDVRPTSGTVTVVDSGSATAAGQSGVSIITGTPTAGSFFAQAINGQSIARIQLSGTWTGAISFEGSVDGGTTWISRTARVAGTSAAVASATLNGEFAIDSAGLTHVRARATAAMTGTTTVLFTFTANPAVTALPPFQTTPTFNCGTGCSSTGGTFNNNADGVATSSTNGQSAAWLYGWNGTGWDRLEVDGSKNLKVAGTFWQATQPVSGTFWQTTQPVSAASLPLPTGASTSALQPTNAAQGSTTSGQTGRLVECAVTTSAPGYTTAQTDPLSCDTAGNLRVNVVAGGAGGGAVYGPTAVGSANANPPVVMGGTATGAAGQNVEGLAIKPASTAPLATDLAAVVAISPNTGEVGTPATGISQATGGVGLSGWLSNISNALTKVFSTSGAATSWLTVWVQNATTPGSAVSASSSPVVIASDQAAVAVKQASQYPATAVPITASNTGTTAATTATLTNVSGHTTYICGYSVRANATAAATVTDTVTGVITATLSSILWVAPLASGLGVDEQIFSPCIPASGVSTSIAVVSGAPGTGGTVSVKAWGYSL